MGVFDDAALDIFTNSDVATTGSYTVQGGAAITVKIIESFGREEDQLLSAGTKRPARIAKILQTEVPVRPTDGDTLTIGDDNFRIRNATPDSAGTLWDLDMDKM